MYSNLINFKYSFFIIVLFFLLNITINAKEVSNQKLVDQVTDHYVQLVYTRYLDSANAVDQLHESIRSFLSEPNQKTHEAAKAAWLKAHSIYSHTEVFRFGNPNVDAWEARVNAWPIDEGLIDYVETKNYHYDSSNPYATQNLIAGRFVTDVTFLEASRSGKDPKETPFPLLADVESNVTTGFHAIEFLLWGQDLNLKPNTAGNRKFTDYISGEACTNKNCKRRSDYLNAASRVMIRDFKIILNDWDPVNPTLYSKEFFNLSRKERLNRILVSMGSLSYGELAGERIRTALLANDQEEEQSCFSDTTHHAIYHNAKGIQTLYLGEHVTLDGTKVTGPSLSDLVRKFDSKLDENIQNSLNETMQAAEKIVDLAENGMPFDQMISADNNVGKKFLEELITALRIQTEYIEVMQENIEQLISL